MYVMNTPSQIHAIELAEREPPRLHPVRVHALGVL